MDQRQGKWWHKKGLKPERWHRKSVSRKEWGRGLVSTEDCVDTRTRGIHYEGQENRTAAANNNNNIRTNRKTMKLWK